MASKFSLRTEALERLIECPICSESVTLQLPPCQHHICQSCLDRIKKDNAGKFLCPECRQVFTGTFPKSLLAESIRDDATKIGDAGCLDAGTRNKCLTGCQQCKDGRIDMRCGQCKVFMCYRCSRRKTCDDKKHDCEDVEDLESESQRSLEAWKEETKQKIASKQAQVQRAIEKIAQLEIEKQTTREEIDNMTSLLSSATVIWENEKDAVERIVFVEQLSSAKPGSNKPLLQLKARQARSQQQATMKCEYESHHKPSKAIKSHQNQDLIKGEHAKVINNEIRTQPAKLPTRREPKTVEELSIDTSVYTVQTLYQILLELVPNAAVSRWINSHNAQRKHNSFGFIKILTQSVLKACFNSVQELDKEMLKSRAPLLKQFYNRDKRREAHALNILEELPEVRENMAYLSDIFYVLSDEDVISDDSFYSWYSDKSMDDDVKWSVAEFFLAPLRRVVY